MFDLTPWIIGIGLGYIAAVVEVWEIISRKLEEWRTECNDARTYLDKNQGVLVTQIDEKINEVQELVRRFLTFWKKELPSSDIKYQQRTMKGREMIAKLVKGTKGLNGVTKRLNDLVLC